ncbi:ClpP/crotonase-like domain-containing protein [Hyaloraphidium curvatum]|nr:ClpP/crotonase-like domain-containing protein [Hyaloraphidium curvatum]
MSYDYQTLTLTKPEPGIAVITHNRPKIKNAMDPESFYEWAHALRAANADASVNVIVVTGCPESNIFTSGARLGSGPDRELKPEAKAVGNTTEYCINCHIDSAKPLIAACNGPAIGIGTTILGLYDFVYVQPTTIFRTPFMPLAFGAEGCSSLTFPTVMGPALANKLLFLDQTFPASDFVACGFVTDVIPKEGFFGEVLKRARALASMPPAALKGTRELVIKARWGGRDRLKEVNRIEMENLGKQLTDPANAQSRQNYIASVIGKGPKKEKL